MHIRLRIRGLAPALLVSAAVGLAFLLPAGAALAVVLPSYGTMVRGGGLLIGGPDAGEGPAPGEAVFIRGNDNAVWVNHFDGTVFSGYSQLFGLTNGDPGASSPPTGTDVFISGADNHLWQNHFNGSTFGGWTLIGGILGAGPDAEVRATATPTIDVYVRGGDGALYYATSTDAGATWGGFAALNGGLIGSPGAVSWASDRSDVFIRGTDSQLWHKYWSLAGGWSGWEPLGGTITSGPDAASCSPGHLDVIAQGLGGGYYLKGWTGTAWTGYALVPGSWTGRPGMTCRPGGAGILDIFGRGLDGALYTVSEPAH